MGGKMTKIKLIPNEKTPVPVEVMADAIVAISEGVKKLMAGPLNEKALILLIQNAAPGIKVGYSTRKVTKVIVKDETKIQRTL